MEMPIAVAATDLGRARLHQHQPCRAVVGHPAAPEPVPKASGCTGDGLLMAIGRERPRGIPAHAGLARRPNGVSRGWTTPPCRQAIRALRSGRTPSVCPVLPFKACPSPMPTQTTHRRGEALGSADSQGAVNILIISFLPLSRESRPTALANEGLRTLQQSLSVARIA